jgi:hypothetical protein
MSRNMPCLLGPSSASDHPVRRVSLGCIGTAHCCRHVPRRRSVCASSYLEQPAHSRRRPPLCRLPPVVREAPGPPFLRSAGYVSVSESSGSAVSVRCTGKAERYAGEMDKRPTTGTHLLRSSSHSYSLPSSVSRMYLLSSRENETRGSASNAEGDCGNPVW